MAYFDHAATTPIDPQILAQYIKDLEALWHNPSSPYRAGVEASRRLNQATRRMAEVLGTREDEWIYTSGATESITSAMLGSLKQKGERRMGLAGFEGDHDATRSILTSLAHEGWPVRLFPLRENGQPDLDQLEQALIGDPAWATNLRYLTVLSVNNETGSVTDLERIRALLDRHAPECLLHVDLVQAPGRIPVAMGAFRPDLASLSGHKLGAPRGVGLLYLRQSTVWHPLMRGGGQQRGRRGGTVNVPLGLAMADALVQQLATQEAQARHAQTLREAVLRQLDEASIAYQIHTELTEGVPAILSIGFPHLRAETLLHLLEADGFLVSTSSACTSKDQDSHVLQAMQLPPELRRGTLRISFGQSNTLEEAEQLGAALVKHVTWLRATLR